MRYIHQETTSGDGLVLIRVLYPSTASKEQEKKEKATGVRHRQQQDWEVGGGAGGTIS